MKRIQKIRSNKSISLLFLSISLIIGLNSFGQNLNPADFQKKMNELTKAPIIDVRTPNEFNQGHLKNAINININDVNFSNLINKLDKNKPVFVYCLSGARSTNALNQMHNQGFNVIYNLAGGMMKWRAAGLPETTVNTTAKAEMSLTQFNKMTNTDKIVVVDYYAEWCAPCKKQAPILKEIEAEMKDKVTILKIDVDQNKEIVRINKITSVPTILIYKGTKVLHKKQGALTKAELMKIINKNL
ncbi:MAG: thioredoxin [Bacteroidetes bacterium]|nr:thioredoxin [Bacteroidota bacterium]